MKYRVELTPDDFLSLRYIDDYTILGMLKDKGFPVKGILRLEVDWSKVERYHCYEDKSSDKIIYEWEEKSE